MTRRKSGPKSGRDPKTGRFLPGNSGKPKGSRHATTIAAERLLDGEAERLTRRAVELALEGDVTALRLCLERILPPRRERSLGTTLPALEGARDVPAALSALLARVASGELTPGEAETLARIMAGYARGLETAELEARLSKLEERLK